MIIFNRAVTLIKPVLIASSVLALSACSTIVNGTNQAVLFDTPNASGADCVLSGGSDNNVNIKLVTPAEVSVPRSKKSLNVTCNKAGYVETTKVVQSKLEGSTGGNILMGGVIGVGVDAMTGALYKYPDEISVVLEQLEKISFFKPAQPERSERQTPAG